MCVCEGMMALLKTTCVMGEVFFILQMVTGKACVSDIQFNNSLNIWHTEELSFKLRFSPPPETLRSPHYCCSSKEVRVVCSQGQFRLV